jgi:uncharacterized protein YggT (Ycf19 family)
MSEPPYEEEVVHRESGEPRRYREPVGPDDPAYRRDRYVDPADRAYAARSSYTAVRAGPAYNYRAIQVTWFVIGLICALLAIRFVLRATGAHEDAGFVSFIYAITSFLVAPFKAMYNTTGTGQYIFEPESLVAIIVYLLLGWAIVKLIQIATAPRGPRRDPL